MPDSSPLKISVIIPVLNEVGAIAQHLNLAIAYLPPLADIDRPEDLAILDLEY